MEDKFKLGGVYNIRYKILAKNNVSLESAWSSWYDFEYRLALDGSNTEVMQEYDSDEYLTSYFDNIIANYDLSHKFYINQRNGSSTSKDYIGGRNGRLDEITINKFSPSNLDALTITSKIDSSTARNLTNNYYYYNSSSKGWIQLGHNKITTEVYADSYTAGFTKTDDVIFVMPKDYPVFNEDGTATQVYWVSSGTMTYGDGMGSHTVTRQYPSSEFNISGYALVSEGLYIEGDSSAYAEMDIDISFEGQMSFILTEYRISGNTIYNYILTADATDGYGSMSVDGDIATWSASEQKFAKQARFRLTLTSPLANTSFNTYGLKNTYTHDYSADAADDQPYNETHDDSVSATYSQSSSTSGKTATNKGHLSRGKGTFVKARAMGGGNMQFTFYYKEKLLYLSPELGIIEEFFMERTEGYSVTCYIDASGNDNSYVTRSDSCDNILHWGRGWSLDSESCWVKLYADADTTTTLKVLDHWGATGTYSITAGNDPTWP